jgi:hypothetical protein
MEAKDRFFRWVVALPLMTGVVSYFNWLLYDAGLLYIEYAAAAFLGSLWVAWFAYGVYADENNFVDWGEFII